MKGKDTTRSHNDLITYRESLGLTRAMLSEKSGVSVGTLCRMEQSEDGYRSLAIGNMEKIATALDITPGEAYILLSNVKPRRRVGNPNMVKGGPKAYKADAWKSRRSKGGDDAEESSTETR